MGFLFIKLQAGGQQYDVLNFSVVFYCTEVQGSRIRLTIIEPDRHFLAWLYNPDSSIEGKVTVYYEVMSKTKEFTFTKAYSTHYEVHSTGTPVGPVKISTEIIAHELSGDDTKFSNYSDISIN